MNPLDEFAKAAMQSIIMSVPSILDKLTNAEIAKVSYDLAGAMVKESIKRKLKSGELIS